MPSATFFWEQETAPLHLLDAWVEWDSQEDGQGGNQGDRKKALERKWKQLDLWTSSAEGAPILVVRRVAAGGGWSAGAGTPEAGEQQEELRRVVGKLGEEHLGKLQGAGRAEAGEVLVLGPAALRTLVGWYSGHVVFSRGALREGEQLLEQLLQGLQLPAADEVVMPWNIERVLPREDGLSVSGRVHTSQVAVGTFCLEYLYMAPLPEHEYYLTAAPVPAVGYGCNLRAYRCLASLASVWLRGCVACLPVPHAFVAFYVPHVDMHAGRAAAAGGRRPFRRATRPAAASHGASGSPYTDGASTVSCVLAVVRV